MNHLHAIVELQQALDEMRSAEELLAGVPDWMRELHEQHSTRQADIDSLEAEIEGLRQERRVHESESADYSEKVKHYQEQISQVRNQREYGALLQEIDSAKEQIRTLEEKALAAMESQEEIQLRLGEEKENFRELDEQHAAGLKKWAAEKPGVEQQAEKLRDRIGVLRERISGNLLSQFERISERYGGQALAPVQKIDRSKGPSMWHCGACNYRVRPQSVVLVQTQGSVELCDSCKRILYFAEAPD
jgi:predicted  nucleic acid-binding Zn-ribbon protein